jgi:hypothetical protein
MITVGCRIFAYYSQMYYTCHSIRQVRQNGKQVPEYRFVPDGENGLPFTMPKPAVEKNLENMIFIHIKEKEK